MVALGTCGLAVGCGLRRDILEPPPYDGAVPDGGFDAVGDGGNCAQTLVPGVGCAEMSLGCIPAGVCPLTWSAAQAQTTCVGYGSITLDSCGSVFRWISSGNEAVTCYYDGATLALQGAQLQTDVPVYCASPGDGGSFSVLIGSVPAGCVAGDGGVIFTAPCQAPDGGAGD